LVPAAVCCAAELDQHADHERTSVDFWDLTKLLFRRWYLTLPMLIFTAVLVMLTMDRVRPDYIATAHVQLVPPVVKPVLPGEASIDQRNPWIGLGVYTLGNAAMVTIQDEAVIQALEDSGRSTSYTLTLSQTSPLVTLEVIGSTQTQAAQTADELVRRYNDSVIALQRAYGVAPADSITTRRLDLGDNLKTSDGKVKRALVAVAGAGLLLTVAFTIGMDALLRRRARRGAGLDATDLSTEALLAAGPRPPMTRGDQPKSRPGMPSRFTLNDPMPALIAGGERSRPPQLGSNGGIGSALSIEYQAQPPVPAVPADRDVTEESVAITVIPPEGTVVLPLTHQSRRHPVDGEGQSRR
jgi:hypothetical protein